IIFAHLILAASVFAAEKPGPLPNTTPWDFPGHIVAEQYRELRDFYERQIQDAATTREAFSRKPPEGQRKLLSMLTGAIDQPVALKADRTPLGETPDYSAFLLSWPLLRIGAQPPTRGSAGTLVRCYGILLEPRSAGKHPAMITVPDSTQSAADLAGLAG